MRPFTFLFPIFLFSCMSDAGVIIKKKDTAAINSKVPIELQPDSNASKLAYAKRLIDTSDSLTKRSITEKAPIQQSDQQTAPIMKEYDRIFRELNPIGKAKVTKYRVQKYKELSNFRAAKGL